MSEDEIMRANWRLSLQQLRQAFSAHTTYGEAYDDMIKAMRNYKALFSQGKHCPPEILEEALLDAKDSVDWFCEACEQENRMDYMKETLALIGAQLPPGA